MHGSTWTLDIITPADCVRAAALGQLASNQRTGSAGYYPAWTEWGRSSQEMSGGDPSTTSPPCSCTCTDGFRFPTLLLLGALGLIVGGIAGGYFALAAAATPHLAKALGPKLLAGALA